MLIFEFLNEPLIATFDETPVYVVVQDMSILKSTQSYSFAFVLENSLKGPNFSGLFTSKKTAGNYFD